MAGRLSPFTQMDGTKCRGAASSTGHHRCSLSHHGDTWDTRPRNGNSFKAEKRWINHDRPWTFELQNFETTPQDIPLYCNVKALTEAKLQVLHSWREPY